MPLRFARWRDPEAFRNDSALLRRDSVPLRKMAARVSVGDLTNPDDLANPEVWMKPRIVLDAVSAVVSELVSCVRFRPRSTGPRSFPVLESVLDGKVWEVVREDPVGLSFEFDPPGRSPDGVEII